MHKSATFICTKAAGKMKIYDRAGFDAVFDAYGDGEDFQLTLEEVFRRRTQAQNRFFHGPICNAFEPLGYRPAEAKDMLCLLFLPHEVRRLDGTIAISAGHTSTLSVSEFNDFIDQCLQCAAEQDLHIADADEWRDALRRADADVERAADLTARELKAAYRRVSRVAAGR